jgi:hypothetical protein
MKYNTHCKCGKKLAVPIWKLCDDCCKKNNKAYQKKYQKEYRKTRIKEYQKEYYAQYRLRNKKYRDDKKKYYDIDKNDIKYYITDELDGSIIGYKLIDNLTR